MTLSVQNIARALDGDVCGRNSVSCPGPGHSRADRSLSVTLKPDAPDGFICHSHAGDNDLACKDFVRDKLGLNKWKPNGSAPQRKIVATYDYVDEHATQLFQVVRFEPKDFRQRRSDGNGGWLWSLGEARRVPYRLPELIEAIATEKPIFIAEGEKAVDALVKLGVPATCSPHGATKWSVEYSTYFAGADVVVLPDNDELGKAHGEIIVKALRGIAKSVRVLNLPKLPIKGDPFDWIAAGGTVEQLWQLVARCTDSEKPRLSPLDVHDLFDLDIPERQMVLDPILPEKGLAMLYAARGIGKTHLACGISASVAAGTTFLKWQALKPRKVLHCDGEMPASELRKRFRQVLAGATIKPAAGMLQILSADLIDMGIGNFASPKVQDELEPLLDGVELLVLDNLSSLTSVIRDNDAESWNPIQEWLLRLRRRGVSVLIVHHAGKGGEQRGTSRREDVLDTSISLRRPSDYIPTEGAKFEVHFEKARGIHGDKAKPFEAKLEIENESIIWTIREIEDVNLARVKALLDDDLSLRDIADETGLSKSQVGRLKKRLEAEAAMAVGASYAA